MMSKFLAVGLLLLFLAFAASDKGKFDFISKFDSTLRFFERP